MDTIGLLDLVPIAVSNQTTHNLGKRISSKNCVTLSLRLSCWHNERPVQCGSVSVAHSMLAWRRATVTVGRGASSRTIPAKTISSRKSCSSESSVWLFWQAKFGSQNVCSPEAPDCKSVKDVSQNQNKRWKMRSALMMGLLWRAAFFLLQAVSESATILGENLLES